MFKIRNATKKDVDTIWKLGNNVEQFETTTKVVTFWPKAIIADCIDKEDISICVAENEIGIIGFTIVNFNKTLKKAEIENIFVIKEFRNQKNGTLLLNYALLNIKEKGYDYVCGLTKDANGFFQKCGFKSGNNFTWMDFIISDNFKK